MKRALIVTTVSGFVPQFEMNNVHILQEMGYEVHYASNFHNPHYGSDNQRLVGTDIICHQVDFVRSPFRVTENIKAYRQLKNLLQKYGFHCIHCHTPMGGVLGRLAAEHCQRYDKKRSEQKDQRGRKERIKHSQRDKSQEKQTRQSQVVVYTAHGFHFFDGAPLVNWLFYYPVERWLAHFTDVLITINEEDFQRAGKFRLRKSAGKRGRVEKVSGVGIDVGYYRKMVVDKEAVRKEIGIEKGQLLLLSIGELNHNKNHKVIIEALAKMGKEICYVICGEGREKRVLEKLIKKYRLGNRVQLLGYRKDIPELLKASDVFVLPSFREGLSLSLQEAMACGVPVIASDIRGNRELIDRGKGGWLLNPRDKTGFVSVIQGIEEDTLARMGRYNCRKIEDYDRERMIEKMKKIYGSIDKEIL